MKELYNPLFPRLSIRTLVEVLVLVVFVFFVAHSFSGFTPSDVPTHITIGSEVFKLEIADTDRLRTQGLSGRDGLRQGEGMLFVFERPGTYGFWMKDMLFSIDIIWLDGRFRVIYLEKNVSPDTYPEVLTPPSRALYVLEVPSGTVQELGIVKGMELEPVFSE